MLDQIRPHGLGCTINANTNSSPRRPSISLKKESSIVTGVLSRSFAARAKNYADIFRNELDAVGLKGGNQLSIVATFVSAVFVSKLIRVRRTIPAARARSA